MSNAVNIFYGAYSLCDGVVVWATIPPFLLLTDKLTNSHIFGQHFLSLTA